MDIASYVGLHTDRIDPLEIERILGIDPRIFSVQRFREKRWSYIGIVHPSVIFGSAVVHLGYLCSAFAFAFDRNEKRMLTHASVLPPAGQIRFDRHPDQGVCRFRSLRGKVVMTHDVAAGIRYLDTDLYMPGRSISAHVKVSDVPERLAPIQLISPMGNGKAVFTHKAAGLTAQGIVTIKGKSIELKPEDTWVIYDWTDGFFDRHTEWNWACGAGRSEDGRRIGFNLSAGVYKSGVTENVVWTDGRPAAVGEVAFGYDSSRPMSPWRVQSRDRAVDLVFQPEGIRRADDNFVIVASRFIQPCGCFSGTIRDRENRIVGLSAVGGVVEAHAAKW